MNVKRFYETGQACESRVTHYVANNIYGALLAWMIWNIDGHITPDWSDGIEVLTDATLLVHVNKSILNVRGKNQQIETFRCSKTDDCIVFRVGLKSIYNVIRRSVGDDIRNDYNSIEHPESLFANSECKKYEDFFERYTSSEACGFDFKIDKHKLLFELIQKIIFGDNGTIFL